MITAPNQRSYKTGQDAHVASETLRENDKLPEALSAIEVAILQYKQEKNYFGLCKALQSRCLTYKHLFLFSFDVSIATKAKDDAQASLSIAMQHHLYNALGSCYFRLGEAENLFKHYREAAAYFQKSLETYEGTNAEKGDYRYHFGEALIRSGKRDKGRRVMLQGLQEIRDNHDEVDSFLIHVWESGGLMKLAELFKDAESGVAKKYLEQARKIIEGDKRLVIRKRQFDMLSKKLQ